MEFFFRSAEAKLAVPSVFSEPVHRRGAARLDARDFFPKTPPDLPGAPRLCALWPCRTQAAVPA